jgi:hypothetical protein
MNGQEMWSNPYEDVYASFGRSKNDVTCKYCGTRFLEWEMVDGKWKLFDTENKLHTGKQCIEIQKENADAKSKQRV